MLNNKRKNRNNVGEISESNVGNVYKENMYPTIIIFLYSDLIRMVTRKAVALLEYMCYCMLVKINVKHIIHLICSDALIFFMLTGG